VQVVTVMEASFQVYQMSVLLLPMVLVVVSAKIHVQVKSFKHVTKDTVLKAHILMAGLATVVLTA
jgi:hypothetical protein